MHMVYHSCEIHVHCTYMYMHNAENLREPVNICMWTLTLYTVVIQSLGHSGQCLVPRVPIGHQLGGGRHNTS